MIVHDTNVVSASAKVTIHPTVGTWLRHRSMSELFVSVATRRELAYGGEKVFIAMMEDTFDRRFAGRILGFTIEASARTGRLRAKRESPGRPISVADAMIAAICLFHGATLATRNTKDLEGLDLALVNPFEDA
ncbi:PIN domain-containing protein [Pararhizobium antarcticum]|uniref:PIN domain-containing protein n=1 Tax=Pararhizobium antarcticum TaxID=1798805 RepID=UPI0008FFD131|nr:PIN domain-containing protein [Pararhizobium antarcticum]